MTSPQAQELYSEQFGKGSGDALRRVRSVSGISLCRCIRDKLSKFQVSQRIHWTKCESVSSKVFDITSIKKTYMKVQTLLPKAILPFFHKRDGRLR